ncbi:MULTISPECIES: hypothetical protein [Alteribacter]|uniref:Sporulation protein n=1 Tax=Alteribacter keqinensis TaxID=2483800 RepID=A0A3M7TSU9_9BACI|nr:MULTISPECIES: hypothetical protein [Alteribacter]MBM7095569.1 hypothetical protein [Alteribacter salitolerans]RNA67832.1 hypothetical protein EBO34_14100 [Alteribacter keqinensis]
MKLILKSLALVMLLVTVGCSDMDTPDVESMNKPNEPNHPFQRNVAHGLFGPGPANYGAINEMRQPQHTDHRENVNGLSYRDPLSARQTIGEDQDMMENVIYSTPGVTPGMILLNGAHAWVNMQIDNDGLTQKEKDAKVREVEEKLKAANPRYEYRVVVNDFR